MSALGKNVSNHFNRDPIEQRDQRPISSLMSVCGQKATCRAAWSLIGIFSSATVSLFVKKSSLQRTLKFPVPLRRESVCK
jgi:hypothetical protein